MKLRKINNNYGDTITVNLDMLGTVRKINDGEVQVSFGCEMHTVSNETYESIKQEIQVEQVQDIKKTINEIRTFIYNAVYMEADAKLKLLQQIETLL